MDRKTAALVLAETILSVRKFAEESRPMVKVQHNTNKLLQSLGRALGKRVL